MEDISRHLGVNRVVPAIGISYPCGDPNLSPEADIELRRKLIYKALQTLTAGATESTERKVA